MSADYFNDQTDYKVFEHNKIMCRGPRPESLKPGEYLCCIGASQTFARHCDEAYPELLSKSLGIPVLNMGWGGAGIRVFFEDPDRLKIINESRGVIVQAMSARTEDTHLYKSISGCWQEDKKTGERHHNDVFLQRIVNDGLYLPEVMRLRREAEINFVESHLAFLRSIKVPALFFWFGEKKPYQPVQDFPSLLGAFPHWIGWDVYRAMAQVFSYDAACFVENDDGYYYKQEHQYQAMDALLDKSRKLWTRQDPDVWIMGEARSASTLICKILNNTVVTSWPFFKEHISPEDDGGIIYSSRKRNKLIRVSWEKYHPKEVLMTQPDQYPQRLYIFTQRRDLVKQVVSAIMAEKIGQWHVFEGQEEEFRKAKIEVTDQELLAYYDGFPNWNRWDDFRAQLEPHRYIVVWYEDLMENQIAEVKRILDFIGFKYDEEDVLKVLASVGTVETAKLRPDRAILEERLKNLLEARSQ